MKGLGIILSIAMAVVAVVGWGGWRGSKKTVAAANAEIVSLSNKLHEATGKIAEMESTLETMRVKQLLQAEDAAGLSNRVAGLTGELAKSRDERTHLRQVIIDRDTGISDLRKEQELALENARGLETQIKSLQKDLALRDRRLAEFEAELQALSEARNSAEARHAQLLQVWNDPSSLRAQQKALARGPSNAHSPYLPSNRPKLTIHTDGSVAAFTEPALP